jgi:hypothetical protein
VTISRHNRFISFVNMSLLLFWVNGSGESVAGGEASDRGLSPAVETVRAQIYAGDAALAVRPMASAYFR